MSRCRQRHGTGSPDALRSSCHQRDPLHFLRHARLFCECKVKSSIAFAPPSSELTPCQHCVSPHNKTWVTTPDALKPAAHPYNGCAAHLHLSRCMSVRRKNLSWVAVLGLSFAAALSGCSGLGS